MSDDAQADAQPDDLGAIWPEGCEVQYGVPTTLECTGLYEDMQTKRLGKGVRRFEPGARLWSDGMGKTRWIKLPEGKQINTRNMDQWKFPIGTKVWKEFRKGDRRVETRLMVKTDDRFWDYGAYEWNAKGTEAESTRGGDILVDGVPYHIPEVEGAYECDECHKGAADRPLGFEAIGLGLDGAKGLTLEKLVDEDLLSHPPKNTRIRIPDDGTGKAAEALAYIHMNCGSGCHNSNDNANSKSKGTGMFLRLDVRKLDGAPSKWDPLATTLGVDAKTPTWRGRTRIVPGDPDGSLIVRLTGIRGTNEQMPPLGTDMVDDEGRQKLIDWIRAMDPGVMDAGMPDASEPDGAMDEDASTPDAGITEPDAASADAATEDADTADAATEDADTADAAMEDADTADAGVDAAEATDDAGVDAAEATDAAVDAAAAADAAVP